MAKQRSLQVSPRTLESHHGPFTEPFLLVVTVAHRLKARREFRCDQPEKADEYRAELKAASERPRPSLRGYR
jgi:hypothetical protein